jgi:outer membrane lipopolysaccharide assembly protein LptE/RlpB
MRFSIPLAVLVCLQLSGCSYSFTGAELKPNLNTVSVETFENNAPIVVPVLSQNFSEALRDRFINQSRLKLTDREGDLQLSGAITSYTIMPANISAGDVATQNEMRIRVQVTFVNTRYPEDNWEQSFERFEVFAATATLTPAAEEELIRQVVDQLTQDIFTKALGDW